jgi:hypothetical protein
MKGPFAALAEPVVSALTGRNPGETLTGETGKVSPQYWLGMYISLSEIKPSNRGGWCELQLDS